MLFEWIADPAAWAGLATLIVLEIVLGIDNLVFIAILADKLPPAQRDKARILGLSLALFMRLALLASVSWIVTLTYPLFTVLGSEISWRDVILIVGGLFLLFKGTTELHERLEGGGEAEHSSPVHAVFWQVIVQIVVLDAVFSLDSVITAVGMVRELSIMMIAVVVAVGVMMLASRPLMSFVSRHPTVVILCLGFLLMIGFSLIVEGLGFHIPKGYLYAAICFSILIEAANQIGRRNVRKRVTTMDLRDRTSRAVLRLLRGGQSAPQTSDEIAVIASTMGEAGAFSPEESAMIERVLTLAERPVRAIMVPRVDTVWLDIADPPAVILDEIRRSGRSRFPVCREEIDEVLGVVHAKDLLAQHRTDGTLDIEKALRQPLYVAETLPILRLLEQFKTSPVHMAVVVDEHGTFEGIVTPTDILVAIAGDLPELAGEETPYAVRQEDGSWLLDARMPVDEVERALGLDDLREDGDEFETLAGFVLERFGHLPAVGEAVEWRGWQFEVLALKGHRIDRVRAGRVAVAEADAR
ncbi:TerC family protein [Ancylobacter sonchi]|uniref:TerC family protein n=1 Tax=Ancylobacter sonchi TaxID=1937790 RepID=UPI001BD6DEF7|nr:TerC family protein [Ancylobacter sonchi]MBS7537325.1 TerC family protein [Ancylobacter sonchi]